MTKTIEEIRKEWRELQKFTADYGQLGKVTTYLLDEKTSDRLADYWLSIIEQRDSELREKIEKMIEPLPECSCRQDDACNKCAGRRARNIENATLLKILSLLPPHNKENER